MRDAIRPGGGLAPGPARRYSAFMLTDTIRARMKDAMKAKRNVEKEILRVCLGEITTEEAR
ncbi:MAG TPA: hypothetical protein ENK57_00820, partial [Polyangiaceae bacterium]|nr:hypothetical protein [Polyangiaceae bacterium]